MRMRVELCSDKLKVRRKTSVFNMMTVGGWRSRVAWNRARLWKYKMGGFWDLFLSAA